MDKLSQNKKIAISAIALFLISFTIMLFFLEYGKNDLSQSQANVINVHNNNNSSHNNSETQYSDYFEEPIESYFVTSYDGKIIHSSDEFCELLSLDCADLIGNSIFNYININDLPEIISNHAKIIQEGNESLGVGPFRLIKKDKELLLLFNAYPILENDKVTEIIYSVKDLTEQVEGINNKNKNNGEKNDWVKELYPKIKDMNDEEESRMMVDKITYHKTE